MSVDALETVIRYLLDDANLQSLVNGQIASQAHYGTGWAVGTPAVRVRLDDDRPETYVQETRVARLEVTTYGDTAATALAVMEAVEARLLGAERARVTLSDGEALLYWALPDSGRSVGWEETVRMDGVVMFWRVYAASV